MNKINEELKSSIQFLNQNTSKKMLLDKLKGDILQAKDEKYYSVLIYYTGHGESEFGGWSTYAG